MHHGKFNVRVIGKLHVTFEYIIPFYIVKVESTADTLFIHLDEIASAEYVHDSNIESKGFLSAVTVRDFPICDKAVDLVA